MASMAFGSCKATPAIYLTEEAHHGFNKIAHMTGLGRRALRMVATDRDLKMNVEELRRPSPKIGKTALLPLWLSARPGRRRLE